MKLGTNTAKLCKYNKFLKKVEHKLKDEPDEDFILVRFDIKNFKLVNNFYGMEAGDRLLDYVASELRRIDKRNSVFCRIDCDRFAAFLPARYEEDIEEVLIKHPIYADSEHNHEIYIYMGIYEMQDKTLPVSMMSDRASIALATVKDNRYHRVAVFDDSMYRAIVEEHELSGELPRALRNGEIVAYLQPQVSADGTVVGAEALVRWVHPEKGFMSPGRFLPIFEKNYKIVEIDKYIWEVACQQIKKWNEIGREDIYVSVNISTRDFECINVYEVLTNLVEKYRINPQQLRIEITESTIMQNPEKQIELIGQLRLAKFYVEMDDFGSGYSSLGMLKDIPLDAIKLDMSFLSKGINVERGRKVLRLMVKLIKELNMLVIAEGVETKAEVEYLKQVGCDVFQGFYFSKPIAIADFERNFL